MAKRFTESEKWKDPWFRQLSPKMKLVWLYILDQCDYAGIWESDIGLMSYQIGFKITKEDINALVSDGKIEAFGKKYIVSAFLDFQYGSKHSNSSVLANCMKRLDKIKSGPTLGLGSPDPGARDMVMVMVKVNSKEEEDAARHKVEREVFDFEAIYASYPRKLGKSKGMKLCAKQIKTKEDYEQLQVAVKNYAARCVAQQTEERFIKHFSSFMSDDYWRDLVHVVLPPVELTYEEKMRKIAERNV